MKTNLFSTVLCRSALQTYVLFLLMLVSSFFYGQTYYIMSGGDYSQTFTNLSTAYPTNFNGLAVLGTGTAPVATKTTTATNDLLAVVGINTAIGYDAVTANSTRMIFLSTGSTDNSAAVACDLNLNFTGRNAGNLTFNYANILNSSVASPNGRSSSLLVYYSTDGASWTSLGGPYTVYNNTEASTANVPVSLPLPSALNNQSTVKLRFYQYNGGAVLGTPSGSRSKISLDDITVTSSAAAAIFTSTVGGGDWSVGASWVGGFVPSAGATVNIVGPVNINNTTSAISNTGIININNNGSLLCAYTGAGDASLTGTGVVNVNGTGILAVEQGGWPGITNTYNYGNVTTGTGTLKFNNITGSYVVNNSDTWFPTTITNVNVAGAGGITLNSGHTVSGLFQSSATITNPGNITIGSTGTLKLNNGYTWSGTGSPVYGSSSLLQYNSTGSPGRAAEWIATSGSIGVTAGYPNHVQVSNNTTLNFANGSSSTYKANGTITIDAGSSLYQNYGSGNAGLSVVADVIVNGNLTLGTTSGDLTVGGNFTVASTGFNSFGRAVVFNGGGNQTITRTTPGTINFDYITVNKSAGNVQLSASSATDITLNATTGDFLRIINTGGFDLNGRSMSLNNNGGGIYVDGARSITSTVAGGKIEVNQYKRVSNNLGVGSLTFGPNVIVNLNTNGNLDFGKSGGTYISTLNGTLSINSNTNCFVNINPPTYGNASLLKYNNGANPYGRGVEWSTTSGAGYPNDIQVTNSTTLDVPTTGGIFTTNLALARDLIIDPGSALYMDYGGGAASGSLTVGRNVVIGGSLSLGDTAGGDMNVAGNWSRTGTFTHNGRLVTFNGTAAQTLTGATTFEYLTLSNSTGLTLQAASAVTVNKTLALSSGKLTLGANDLTIGSTGTITGSFDATKYIKANSTGQLKRTVDGSNILFPVGNAAYNPITFNNSGTSDIYGVRVVDAAPAGANPTKTVNRQWITTEAVAGGSNLAVVAQYNTGETGAGFAAATDGFIGHYNGSAYTQVPATLGVSNPFTATSNANLSPADLTTGTQYFAVGKDNGFLSTATKFVITAITPTSPIAGSGFNVTVRSQDAYGAFSKVVANTDFTLSSNGNAGTIGGTMTGSINAGASTVTVTGVILPNPGTGVTLTATRTSGDALIAGISSTFTVIGVATQLKFAGVPSTGTAGTNLTTFTVEARRADNTLDTNFNGSIAIAKATGSGNISGTLTKTAVAGVSTFDDIQFDAADTYTITTTSGILTSATSGNIVISPNPANAYFRSNAATGNWNVPGSWESSIDGLTGWATAQVAPTAAANTVTIRNGHTIKITANVNIDQVVIENNGVLETLNAFSINNGILDDIIILDGGTLKYNSSDRPTFSASATISAETNGRILLTDGSASTLADNISPNKNNYVYKNASILEYDQNNSFSASDVTYFPNADANTVPIFRISNVRNNNVGGKETFLVNGLLQLGNGVSLGWGGTGTKIFRNGIVSIGTSSMDKGASTGPWKIGNGTLGNAELGGSTGTLTLKNDAGISIAALCNAKLTSNIKLDTNTKFTVESGAILDFGFDSSNVAVNIIRNGSTSGQTFTAASGSTLKITSPDGISNGTSVYTGNVQIGADATKRIFSPDGTFHYIGKANQVTGNGLPAAASNKKVIVDLGDNSYQLTTNNINYFNSGYGLDIRKGTVIVSTGNGFADEPGQNANLTMAAGTRLVTTRPNIQPELTGNYTLADNSTIEFAYTKPSGTSWQSIRGGPSYSYPRIEVSGADVQHRSGNINLKANGLLLIKNGGTLTSTVDNEQIVSVDNTQPAILEIKANGIFRTASAVGFYGPYGGFGNNSPSVRNNVNLNFNIDGIVEYGRLTGILPTTATDGNQSITEIATGYPILRMDGDGIKTPDSKNLLVNNYVDVTSTATTLKIPETSENTVPYVVYGSKGIKVVANGKAIFKNNAQLMQDSDANNSGKVTMERIATIPVSTFNQYVYWSSPVMDQNFKDIFPGNPTSALYHTENNNKFYTSTGAYIAGRSLAVRNPIFATGSSSTLTASLKGTPYNADLDYALNFTDAAHGYNLVGNPYPSNLNLNELYNHSTNIESTFLFWDNTSNIQQSQKGDLYEGYSYAKYNAATGSGTGIPAPGNGAPASNNSKTPNNILKVGQGFMVRAKGSGSSVAFKNTDRITSQTAAQFYGKAGDSLVDDRYFLEFVTPENLVFTNAVVYFENGKNYYAAEDSKFESSVSEGIFTQAEEEKVVINGRSSFLNTDVIKVGSRQFATGLYKIRLGAKEGIFANGQKIYLKDIQTGIFTNLSEGNYTFAANAGESTGRFEIVYVPQQVLGTSVSAKENIKVYREGQDFVVQSSSKIIDEVEVFDVSGRLMQKVKANFTKVLIDGNALISGVYLLKIKRNNEIISKKIVK